METINNMKSVAEIIKIVDDKYTYIPLLQRNYKWTMECASELAEDLWEAFKNNRKKYQLNMVTIYKNNEDSSLQILDGQQRLITLKLFLTFLEKKSININCAFERDFKINERRGRRYFIDYNLTKDDIFQNDIGMSVDIKRLYENFVSMIIPVSFRSIYGFYRGCHDKVIGEETKEIKDFEKKKKAEDFFKNETNGIQSFIESCLEQLLGDKKSFDGIKGYIEPDVTLLYELCCKFEKSFSNKDKSNEISDDEIRISEYSNQYQEMWSKNIHKIINKVGIDNIITDSRKKGMADYIKKCVEMLYHETTSEPIDEFLNINENKTRFVISDYIRANMISDNPIDGKITEEKKKENEEKRKEILNLFSSLGMYLYDKKYKDMWDLIKQRYDDFDTYPDINRLKILFCDTYVGTSTKGYSYEGELARLTYFEKILKSLSCEIGIGLEDKKERKIVWSTYNAVYMLLECKKDYRFFNLFTDKDISDSTELSKVTVRERFCFFELAYILSKSSGDFWDISYFLESQLYAEKCEIKKSEHLPEKSDTEWCFIDRGTEDDPLHKCIEVLIENIKKE